MEILVRLAKLAEKAAPAVQEPIVLYLSRLALLLYQRSLQDDVQDGEHHDTIESLNSERLRRSEQKVTKQNVCESCKGTLVSFHKVINIVNQGVEMQALHKPSGRSSSFRSAQKLFGEN